MKLSLFQIAVGAVVALNKGLWRTLDQKGEVAARMMETAIAPKLKKWQPEKPFAALPRLSIAPAAGPVAAFLHAALRPWKFTDKMSQEAITDPKRILEAKIDGIGCEMEIDKGGKLKRLVSMRGEKVDLRNGVPELRDAAFPEQLRNSKIYVEIRHPRGSEFTSGLLHASRDNAEAVVREHGHPDVYILAIHKMDGKDTSKLTYDDMRGLRELVAQKIPHGAVPLKSGATEQDKARFREEIKKENAGKSNHLCDGIVVIPTDQPNKGTMMAREKFPQSWDFVVLGFEESTSDNEKFGNGKGVASLIIGDGARALGKVNVANPDMRVTIKQNPQRYLGKVVEVEGLRRTATGAVVQSVLKSFRWDKDPKDVEKWDPEAPFREQAESMEPDPAKRERLKHKLNAAASRKM